MKKKGLVLFLLSALLFTACGTEKNKTEETDKLTVVTSFYPVYLLAQEIVQGAEGIRLENMAQPQTGCLHDYELSISDMKLLETADIFIINGGGPLRSPRPPSCRWHGSGRQPSGRNPET